MNKVFRVVWNETLGSWVVVSEMAKSKVKTQRKRLKKAISNIILFSLTVVPASFVLANGIYINESSGMECAYIDSEGVITTHTDTAASRYCQPRNVNNQTNRILFYGEVNEAGTSSATKNLLVGGTAYVNSGSLGLGGGQNGTSAEGSIRIGGGVAETTSLDSDGEVRRPAGTIGSTLSGSQSIAIGGGASNAEATIASADYAIALGYKSQANAKSSIAMGNTTNASGIGSLAMGDHANANLDNSVALGANSITTASEGNGYLTNQTFTSTNVFSVGSDTLKRRIQNVADGAEDSDAVTIAQLKEVSLSGSGGGFGLTAEDGESVQQDLGKSIKLVGADDNILTKVGTDDDGNNQVEIELSKDLTGLNSIEMVDATDPDKKTTTTAAGTFVTDGENSSLYGANGVNINDGSVTLDAAGLNVGGVTVSSTGINANNKTISNVATATEDNQAVNLAQLKAISSAATEGGGFGLTAEDGENVQQDLGKSIKLVGADDNILTKVGADEDGNNQVEIELSKDLTGLNSIEMIDATDPDKKTTTTAAGTFVTDGTNSTLYGANGININNGSVMLNAAGLNVGGVTVSSTGINANNKTISNVATATEDDQAVNLGQLNERLEGLSTGGGSSSGGIQYDDPDTKDSVTLGGENGTTIGNLKDGEIAQGSTEAVNGGQIFDLENNLQGQITNNSNEISNLQNQINNMGEGTGNGLVQQETSSSEVTVAANSGGNSVNVAGTDGDRKLTGVADGNIAENSVDAVNGGQLQTNYNDMASSLGGGAKFENGTWTGPEYTVGLNNETTVNNVGDAIDALNKSDQMLDTKITNLDYQLNNINDRMDRLEKDTYSGIAASIAIASLPQPTEKGYTMMSAGTGVWRGESGLAVGASGVTEDKKLFKKQVNYIWKFASTVDSRSNWGGGASVGVQWK